MRAIFSVLAVAAAVLPASVCWPQAHTRTTTADIRAAEMVYDIGKNQFTFTGSCVLQISGPNTAEMTAPKMVFELGREGATLRRLTAFGPVKMTVITRKDKQGQRRRIVARCSEQATYKEPEQVVEMRGDCVADIVTLPETPDSQRFHFNMERLVVDLRTGKLTAKPARVRFEGTIPAGEGSGKKEQ